MVHKRSTESIEYRQARFFCLRNSKLDWQLQERIFLGDEEDLRFFVQLIVENAHKEEIPVCPKGLVITDNRARGAFDSHPEFEGKERFVDDQ